MSLVVIAEVLKPFVELLDKVADATAYADEFGAWSSIGELTIHPSLAEEGTGHAGVLSGFLLIESAFFHADAPLLFWRHGGT